VCFKPLASKLVAESGVSPDDFLVMSQVSLFLLHFRVKDRVVGIEPTMIGFADRRLTTLLRPASWSGRRELNPHVLIGNQALYR
jgi:hypothetical protein